MNKFSEPYLTGCAGSGKVRELVCCVHALASTTKRCISACSFWVAWLVLFVVCFGACMHESSEQRW